MKKLLILMILFPLVCFGQTRPHWSQIAGKPVVDVRDFGAKGDNASKDNAAFAAAVAAVASGGTILVPQGHYWTSGITLPAGVSLVGGGVDSTIIQSSDKAGLVAMGDNTHIRDLTLFGVNSATGAPSSAHNLAVQGEWITVDNVKSYGSRFDSLIIRYNARNVKITNSYFGTTERNTVSITGATHVIFDNCFFYQNDTYGGLSLVDLESTLEAPVHDITFRNSQFASDRLYQSGLIIGNPFNTTATDTVNVLVDNCRFLGPSDGYACNIGIRLRNNATGVLRGVNVINSRFEKLALYTVSGESVTLKDSTIIGNKNDHLYHLFYGVGVDVGSVVEINNNFTSTIRADRFTTSSRGFTASKSEIIPAAASPTYDILELDTTDLRTGVVMEITIVSQSDGTTVTRRSRSLKTVVQVAKALNSDTINVSTISGPGWADTLSGISGWGGDRDPTALDISWHIDGCVAYLRLVNGNTKNSGYNRVTVDLRSSGSLQPLVSFPFTRVIEEL